MIELRSLVKNAKWDEILLDATCVEFAEFGIFIINCLSLATDHVLATLLNNLE